VLTSSTSKTEQPLSMVAHRLSVHQHHGERATRPLSMVAHCLSHDPREAETEVSMVDEKQQEEKEEMVDQPVSNHAQDQQEKMVDQPENRDENQQEEKEEMVDQPVSNHDQDQQEETVDQPENHDENQQEEKDQMVDQPVSKHDQDQQEKTVDQPENNDEKEEMYDQPLSMVAHCVALYQKHQQLNNYDSAEEEKTVVSYNVESDAVISSGNVNCVEVAPCGSDDSHQQLTQQQLHNNDDSCQPAADQNITALMKKTSDNDDSSETAAEGVDCTIGEADSVQNGGQIEDQATKEVEAVEVERLEGVTASRRESDVEEEDLESAVVFTLSLGQLQQDLFLHSFSVQNCCFFFLRVYGSIKLEITCTCS
jgi:hypothetical protein